MLLQRIKMGLIRYAFQGSYGSVVLRLMRKFNMEKQAIKELLYGGVSELMKNKRYYYVSSVSKDYNKWTEEGLTALNDFVGVITHYIIAADENDLDRRAKEIVFNSLKS